MWIGILILTLSLILSCGMGLLQESIYKKSAHSWKEGLFYSVKVHFSLYTVSADNLKHALSLPLFLCFNLQDIQSEATYYKNAPVSIWFALLTNAVTQFVCIMGVHSLSSRTSALTLTLVLTVRKFVSLLLSLYWFENEFETYHWIGAFLVFVGSSSYCIASRNALIITPAKRKSKKSKQT